MIIGSAPPVTGIGHRLHYGEGRGRPTTVHAEGCQLANGNARPLATMAALDALAGPGAGSCDNLVFRGVCWGGWLSRSLVVARVRVGAGAARLAAGQVRAAAVIESVDERDLGREPLSEPASLRRLSTGLKARAVIRTRVVETR
ncbi:DUF6233 domain-containing protein [Streptomyces sp. NPDC055005]